MRAPAFVPDAGDRWLRGAPPVGISPRPERSTAVAVAPRSPDKGQGCPFLPHATPPATPCLRAPALRREYPHLAHGPRRRAQPGDGPVRRSEGIHGVGRSRWPHSQPRPYARSFVARWETAGTSTRSASKCRNSKRHLDRAVHRGGSLVGVSLSDIRDLAAAEAFFRSAWAVTGERPTASSPVAMTPTRGPLGPSSGAR